jgi:hypothetical protein
LTLFGVGGAEAALTCGEAPAIGTVVGFRLAGDSATEAAVPGAIAWLLSKDRSRVKLLFMAGLLERLAVPETLLLSLQTDALAFDEGSIFN